MVVGEFYAIRAKGTMKYLPEICGAGYTYTEPVAGPQPRLFPRSRAAAQALTAWLKGTAEMSSSTDWETGYTEYVGLKYTPVEGRRADAMEIVKLVLVTAE
jgi:hypothetical protein